MTKKTMNQKQKHLLDAAGQIVQTQGPGRLTLAAVAKEANVSKGGLLHYFPNKNALIEGLIVQLIDAFEVSVTQKAASSDDPTAWLRAYINTTFDPQLSQAEGSAGILAAVANNPELLAPLYERYQQWQHQIENSDIDPALATVLRLAADGLWFSELLGFGVLDEEKRAATLQTLIRLLDEAQ